MFLGEDFPFGEFGIEVFGGFWSMLENWDDSFPDFLDFLLPYLFISIDPLRLLLALGIGDDFYLTGRVDPWELSLDCSVSFRATLVAHLYFSFLTDGIFYYLLSL